MSEIGYETFKIVYADSSYDFSLFPQAQFTENYQVEKSLSRSINGTLHSFKIKDSINYQHTFPLAFVNSSDAFKINDLWETQTVFDFEIGDDINSFTYTSRITNMEKPLNKRTRQQFDLYEGFLTLRSTNNVEFKNPFILDDPIFGVLDGTLGLL